MKNKNIYWFFRSFYISALTLTLVAAFFLGVCVAWQRMQYTAFGTKDAKPIEWTEEGLRILDIVL